jgi:hypothetical protein
MDVTNIAVAVAVWCVISIPAGLLIGGVIAAGTRAPAEALEVKRAA